MAFHPVQLLVTPTYAAMPFDGSWEKAQELVGNINDVLANHTLGRGEIIGLREGDNPPEWRIRLIRPDGVTLEIFTGWWVVAWSTGVIEAYDDAAYRAKFTLPEGMQ